MKPGIEFVEHATRILFFTGKGGVGKTSVACATAVALVDRGKRVLLVSTDPASNLDEVLETRLSGQPEPVNGIPRLFAMNIDPESAARAYRERVVGPYRGILPGEALASMEEQLSGACTVEIAAFDEFTKLLGDPAAAEEFDHIIFDMAPTGHTLRLLKLPAAWTGFMSSNVTGTSCLGPLAGLQDQRALYQASLDTLCDHARTTFVLVSRPERSALAEVERTRRELSEMGITSQQLVLNGFFTAHETEDAAAQAFQARCQEALGEMPVSLIGLPRVEIPLLPFAPIGIAALRRVFLGNDEVNDSPRQIRASFSQLPPPLDSLVDEIERSGHGVIMTMGKGGVGKTTIAAAIATELANRGHRVHLTTTDPAAHVSDTVGIPPPGLIVSRIDPVIEIRKYTDQVLASADHELDAAGRALLEEDLRSPCTEEIAVFRAFARTVAEGEMSFVVLDTAPTGHTLLLLDATKSYHREVSRTTMTVSDEVRHLLPRLRDPDYTKILLVTLPEATPVHEASRLQDDLLRAGIVPYAWIINQSFAATGSRDPILVERANREFPFIAEVQNQLANRLTLIPWKTDPPKGQERLLELARSVAKQD